MLEGSGKLHLESICKAYGLRTLIQAQNVIFTNVTDKDILPKFNLSLDCCDLMGEKVPFEQISLDLPIKHVINGVNDLKYASHKVDEIQQKIAEEEWKISHQDTVSKLSLFAYFCAAIIILLVICCVCCKCGCCKLMYKWYKNDDSCCKQICFRPTIVNKIQQHEDVAEKSVIMSHIANRIDLAEQEEELLSSKQSPKFKSKSR
jgi:hypothetical protein